MTDNTLRCSEKGCAFPAMKESFAKGLCIVHLKQREITEGVGSKFKTPQVEASVSKPIPKVKPKSPAPVLSSLTSKITRAEQDWTWEYIAENEAELWRDLAPSWGFLYRALESLKEGQCVKLALPEGEDLTRTRKRIGTSVRNQFVKLRWKVLTGADRKHIVIMQNGTWKERQEELRQINKMLNDQKDAA